MKKLMVSAFALAMMTTGAMAGEQLTTAQLDQVTAGRTFQINFNATFQRARASADANQACVIAVCQQVGGGAIAVANNSNSTRQSNRN